MTTLQSSFDLERYQSLYDTYWNTEYKHTAITNRTKEIASATSFCGLILVIIGIILAIKKSNSPLETQLWSIGTILIAAIALVILIRNQINNTKALRQIHQVAHHDNISEMTNMIREALQERYRLRNIDLTYELVFHNRLIDTLDDSMRAPLIEVLTEDYQQYRYPVRIIDGQPTLMPNSETPNIPIPADLLAPNTKTAS